jgi:hypothetical protein
MPSINAGDLESCLLTKLRAIETQGRDRKFEIQDDAGRVVARTRMSKGWRQDDAGRVVARTRLSKGWRGTTPIGVNLVSEIKKQLFLPRSTDLIALVSCTLSREEYLKIFS